MTWTRRLLLPAALLSSFTGGLVLDRTLLGGADPAEEPAVAAAVDEERPPARCPSHCQPRNASYIREFDPGLADAIENEQVTAAELFERALALDDEDQRRELLYEALERLRPQEAREALTWAERIENGDERVIFTRGVIVLLVQEEPQAALALANDLPGGRSRRLVQERVFRAWLENDSDEATRWAMALPQGELRTSTLRDVIDDLARRDPQAALEMTGLLGPAAGSSSTGMIIEHWAMTDPEAAAAQLAQMPVGAARFDSIGSVARGWADRDPEAAMAWARSLPTAEEMSRATTAVALTRAQDDPAGAIQQIMNITEIEDYTFGTLASSWVRDDAEAALAFIEAMPEGERREAALRASAMELATEQPMAAARVGLLLEPGGERQRIIEDITVELAAEDLEEALSWASSLEDEGDRRGALSQAISLWADRDPEAATRYAESLADGPGREAAMRQIALSRTRHDPVGAARWVVDHGADLDTVSQVTRDWSEIDLEGASRWASSLPRGESRDGALAALSDRTRYTDPAEAWRWAQQIEDAELRSTRLEDVARSWYAEDEVAAQDQIEQTDDLPESLRAELLGEEAAPSCCPCSDLALDELAEAPDYDDEEGPEA